MSLNLCPIFIHIFIYLLVKIKTIMSFLIKQYFVIVVLVIQLLEFIPEYSLKKEIIEGNY